MDEANFAERGSGRRMSDSGERTGVPNATPRRRYVFSSRGRPSLLDSVPSDDINYKNVSLLLRFISEGGRIIPSRVTTTSAKRQRRIAREIKRAHFMAMLRKFS